jgi:hypothetical protein
MPKMNAGDHDPVDDEEDDEDDELTKDIDESVQPKNTSKLARLMRKIRGGAEKVKKKGTPGSSEPIKTSDQKDKKSARSAAADAQMTNDASTEYLRQPRYACGQLFVSSIVTSLAVNSYYNPSLAHMIEGMIDAQIVMVDVGKGWHREPFYDFYKHVLENRDLLAIGIFRKVMVDNKQASGFQEANKAKERLMGKKKKKAKSIFALMPDNYVFSSPPAKSSFLTQDDTVICIMKKDWSKIPERYGPQLRAMDYRKHGNLQKQAQQGLNMLQPSNMSQASMTQSSMAISNAKSMSAAMNTTQNSMVLAGDPMAQNALMNAHLPPGATPTGTWSAMRETAGSAAVGGPLALPPPPGVKGPANPHLQVGIPGQL